MERAWLAYVGSVQDAHSLTKWASLTTEQKLEVAAGTKRRAPAEYNAVCAALAAADQDAVPLDDAARERAGKYLAGIMDTNGVYFTRQEGKELFDAAINALTKSKEC